MFAGVGHLQLLQALEPSVDPVTGQLSASM
jgi:hypothetical protein